MHKKLNFKTNCLAVCLMATAFLFHSSAEAQVDFSGGLELGASSTQLSGDALSGFDKFGLSAGPYVRMSFSEKSSAKLSVLYINKGSRKNADPDNGDLVTYAIKLDYIEVPVLYNYTYDKLRGEAGVAIGTLVSSKELGTDGIERSFVQPFEKSDVSVVFGLNYLFSEKIFANLRWSQSVIPVRKAPNVVNPGSFYEAGMYNTALQLMFGFEF